MMLNQEGLQPSRSSLPWQLWKMIGKLRKQSHKGRRSARSFHKQIMRSARAASIQDDLPSLNRFLIKILTPGWEA